MKTVIEYKDIFVSICPKSTFLPVKMDSPMLREEPGKFHLPSPFLNRIFQYLILLVQKMLNMNIRPSKLNLRPASVT